MPFLGPPLRNLFASIHSPTEHLGSVLLDLAMVRHQDRLEAGRDVQKVGKFSILENRALRRLAGQ